MKKDLVVLFLLTIQSCTPSISEVTTRIIPSNFKGSDLVVHINRLEEKTSTLTASFSFNISSDKSGVATVAIPLDLVAPRGELTVSKLDDRWRDWNLVPHEVRNNVLLVHNEGVGDYRIATDRVSEIYNQSFTTPEARVDGDSLEEIPYFSLQGQTSNDRVWVVFVHGSGSELVAPRYRWDNFLRYLGRDSEEALKYRDSFSSLMFRYGSRNSIRDSGEALVRLIHDRIGKSPYIIVSHSMGGLVARTAYALHRNVDSCLGIITLGTPHRGSPLAIPDWMWALFSQQELARLKFGTYLAFMNDFTGGLAYLQNKKLREVLYDGKVPLLNQGERDMAFDGTHPGIPSKVLPKFSLVNPLTELSPDDKAQTPCNKGVLYYGDIEGVDKVSVGSGCYYNYPEALTLFNSVTPIEPYIVAYGGYYPTLAPSIGDREEFVEFSLKSLGDVAMRKKRDFEDRGLRWAAGIMGSLPTDKQEDISSFCVNDGLVSLESALFLNSTDERLLTNSSSLSNIAPNTSIIAARKNKLVIEQRIFPVNHREIVEGVDDSKELFGQLVRDIVMLDRRARSNAPLVVSLENKEEMIQDTKWRWSCHSLVSHIYREGFTEAKMVFHPIDWVNGHLERRAHASTMTATYTWIGRKFRFIEERKSTSIEQGYLR